MITTLNVLIERNMKYDSSAFISALHAVHVFACASSGLFSLTEPEEESPVIFGLHLLYS